MVEEARARVLAKYPDTHVVQSATGKNCRIVSGNITLSGWCKGENNAWMKAAYRLKMCEYWRAFG